MGHLVDLSDVSRTVAAEAGSTALARESEPACIVSSSVPKERELYTKHIVPKASQMASNLLQEKDVLLSHSQ